MLSYAITDPSTLDFDFLEYALMRFSKKASMILYRDKETPYYTQNAKQFIEVANRVSFDRVLLHSRVDLADRLGADGVHLTSRQFNEIEQAKTLGLFVVISTHTLAEAKKAENLGADMLTYSPVFDTPNKGKAVGLDALKDVTAAVDMPVIALGGILTDGQIDACRRSGAGGFASIRYFS